MPLNIEVKGSPDSIRATAKALSQHASVVFDAGTTARSARSESEQEWQGSAGDAFRSLLNELELGIDDHESDLTATSVALIRYADDLATAQARMSCARDIAMAGGLEVTSTTISDPGPPPALPGSAEAVPAAASLPAMAWYAAKVAAYQAAAAIVAAGKKILEAAWEALKDFLGGILEKVWFNASDLAVGVTVAASQQAQYLMKLATKNFERWRLGNYAKETYGPTVPSRVFTHKQNALLHGVQSTLKNSQRWSTLASSYFGKIVGSTLGSTLQEIPVVGKYVGKLPPIIKDVPVLGAGITALSTTSDLGNCEKGKRPATVWVSNWGQLLINTGAFFVVNGSPVGRVVKAAGVGLGGGWLLEKAGTFLEAPGPSPKGCTAPK